MWAKARAVGNAVRVVHGSCRCAVRRIARMSTAVPPARFRHEEPEHLVWEGGVNGEGIKLACFTLTS
jgi:hypothetical protein